MSDVAQERRIADHETIEDHFERFISAISHYMIEFDERILRIVVIRAETSRALHDHKKRTDRLID